MRIIQCSKCDSTLIFVKKQNLCRKCYSKEYRTNNKDRINKLQQDYKAKDPQRWIQYSKDWSVANKDLIRISHHKSYYNNLEERRLYTLIHNKNRRLRVKQIVIAHYSKNLNECNCCRENIFEFLTLDHIHGGGNAHRRELKLKAGVQFNNWLIKNNFPEGYQILCYNCNTAKAQYGICPHINLK